MPAIDGRSGRATTVARRPGDSVGSAGGSAHRPRGVIGIAAGARGEPAGLGWMLMTGSGGRDSAHRRDLAVEVLAAVILSLAVVGTAWSGYQSARWSGVQANTYSAANASRLESTRSSTRAGQLAQVDVASFIAWSEAYAGDEPVLERFLYARFRPPMKRAVDAWLATRPLANADAPATPFAMPEYQLAEQADADRLLATADAAAATARQANQRSDNYVLAVVLFASALFFAGIASKFSNVRARLALVALGAVVMVGTGVWIATFPVTISV